MSTCKDVPHCCRFLWASILTQSLTSAVKENTVEAWTLLAMLPKCVLPAPFRGGRKGHTSYSTYVENRMKLWLAGEYLLLWEDAQRDHYKKRSRSRDSEIDADRAAIRAELLARQGEFSRGMAALTAAPMAPDNADTLEKLLEKHPDPHENPLQNDLPPIEGNPLHLEETEVKKAIVSFRRGSSAGTMGLRPEHLQAAILEHVDKDVNPLSALTRLVNHMLQGKAPQDVQSFYAGARLCALEKGEDDVRPIAAGETLRRLVSKAACISIKEKAGTLFNGRQYGVAAPAGAERVIHLCRRAMLNNLGSDNFVFCKVDLRNAFNNVSRPVLTLTTRLNFPELSPWVEWCYSKVSCLTYRDNVIPSAEGVQQGDPLGPLLFSLVLSSVTEEISSRSNLDTQLWYLDDGVLIGEAEEVRKALDVFSNVGSRCGLFLNPSKCEIITPPASSHLTGLFPEIPKTKTRTDGNFDILGSPIGSAEHCVEFLRSEAIEPARETLDAIGFIGDPQVAMSLIRQCTGFCQMVYALRTTPPQALSELCNSLDENVLKAAEWALFPLDSHARDQIQRKKRNGGFGLRSSLLHATAAYVSSVAHAADADDWDPSEAEGFTISVQDVNRKAGVELVDPGTGRIPKQNKPHPESSQRHNLTSRSKRPRHILNNMDADKTAEPEMVIPRQQQLSQAISQQEFTTAYGQADPRTRARWVSQSGKGAGSWAFVTPSRSKGFAFTPTEFRTLSRWWFGMDIYGQDRPCPANGCSLHLQKNGEHALLCKNGHGLITRHNALCVEFASFCSKANMAPQREKSLGNRGPGGGLTRPADVFLPTYTLGKGMVLDFAVTHAQQTKYLDSVRNASWVAAGSFAEHYSETKEKQRQEAEEAQLGFTAMVVESFGSWSKSAMAVLWKVGALRANSSKGLLTDAQARNDLLKELNVTLMRSQARMMVSRIVVSDPQAPLEGE